TPWIFGAGIALTFATPFAAIASITPAAQEVVDRYVEATGGRAALDREHSFHSRGTVWGAGLRGSIETWARVPNQVIIALSLGTLRIQTGCDGSTGWRTDLASRKVTVLDGKELEGIAADAY